jgi:transcriptional regulator with XRE-family HTH domain
LFPQTSFVAKAWTNTPFREELPELLESRSMTLRELAREVGVGHDHLSRVVSGSRSKRASAELTRKVAAALDLPEDYFPEARLAFVVERLAENPKLRDELYIRFRREESTARRRRPR